MPRISAQRSAHVVGDHGHPELHPCLEWLATRCRLTWAPSITAGVRACRRRPPELIVIAQARPGRITAGDVDRLAAAAPLARLVGLLGSWCEGETRTGYPWPGVSRMYWHQFIDRIRREWLPEEAGLHMAPRTATEVERVLAAAVPTGRQGRIAVHSGQRTSYESWTEALAAAGYSIVSPAGLDAGASAADVGVWDCSTCPRREMPSLRAFVQSLEPAPVVVLAGFPRSDDVRDAQDAGAACLLSKPLVVGDLIERLEALCPTLSGVSLLRA